MAQDYNDPSADKDWCTDSDQLSEFSYWFLLPQVRWHHTECWRC